VVDCEARPAAEAARAPPREGPVLRRRSERTTPHRRAREQRRHSARGACTERIARGDAGETEARGSEGGEGGEGRAGSGNAGGTSPEWTLQLRPGFCLYSSLEHVLVHGVGGACAIGR